MSRGCEQVLLLWNINVRAKRCLNSYNDRHCLKSCIDHHLPPDNDDIVVVVVVVVIVV